MAAGSHIGFDLDNIRPPTKCNCWSEVGPQIWSWSDLWFIVSPNDVTHRPNPQKVLPYAETRRLSHKAWKSVQWFDLGAFPRKKDRTRHDSQKSHKVVIFRLYGEKPPLYGLVPKFAWCVAFIHSFIGPLTRSLAVSHATSAASPLLCRLPVAASTDGEAGHVDVSTAACCRGGDLPDVITYCIVSSWNF